MLFKYHSYKSGWMFQYFHIIELSIFSSVWSSLKTNQPTNLDIPPIHLTLLAIYINSLSINYFNNLSNSIDVQIS